MEAKTPPDEGCSECAPLLREMATLQRKGLEALAAERLRADSLETAKRALEASLHRAQAALAEHQEQARLRQAQAADALHAIEQRRDELDAELALERGLRVAATTRGDRLQKRLNATQGFGIFGGIALGALALGRRR